jgi:hypothetical protein
MGANWRLVAARPPAMGMPCLKQNLPAVTIGPGGKKAVFMQLKNTRAPGASQARFCTPNPHADATRRSRLKFAWLEQLNRLVAEEAGRNACKIQKVSHRLVCDLAETFARYPSFTQHGEVWAAQATLALQLGVDVRQVRRAIAVLLQLKVLSVKRPSRGRRRDTNTMVALFDERPLFVVVESDHRACPSAEYRTPTSPNYRATASSNSMEEELKNDSSPVGRFAVAQARPHQADGMQSTTAEASASAPSSQSSFARLFDDYPHPPGAVEIPAYYPHARKAWNKLSNEQKQSAQLTAQKAPGERWLGHWLDDGRETGEFRVADRHTDEARVWVREGTPEFEAWRENYRANGRRLPTIQHRVGGQLQTGWMFESERPPTSKKVCVGGGA